MTTKLYFALLSLPVLFVCYACVRLNILAAAI